MPEIAEFCVFCGYSPSPPLKYRRFSATRVTSAEVRKRLFVDHRKMVQLDKIHTTFT
jgi:hypothetical protein